MAQSLQYNRSVASCLDDLGSNLLGSGIYSIVFLRKQNSNVLSTKGAFTRNTNLTKNGNAHFCLDGLEVIGKYDTELEIPFQQFDF